MIAGWSSVRLPAHEVGFAQGRIAITAVRFLQKPECSAAGQQHLGRAWMQTERFGQLRNRGAGAACKVTEQALLVCCSQGLESPEAGRKCH